MASPERDLAGHVAIVTGANHGMPEDVADIIAFLCSDLAKLITASVIRLR